jgi:hypothetical protein
MGRRISVNARCGVFVRGGGSEWLSASELGAER